MRLSVPFVVILSWLFAACGPLPRAGHLHGTLPTLAISRDASGVVLSAVDSSYSSTDVYIYDFGTGQLAPLATGESGDLLVKWESERLWLFNRSSGRVSYSTISPRIGPSSRSVERRTPDGVANDPADMLTVSDDEALLAMGSGNKITAFNPSSGLTKSSSFGPVDTGDTNVPFRPAVMGKAGASVLVAHQSLDRDWVARGAGKIYYAIRDEAGVWEWLDQNVTSLGVQGVPLFVSNPVSIFGCHGAVCYIGGACYQSMGAACLAGVDELNWQTKTVRHVLDWPAASEGVGVIVAGFADGQVLTCFRANADVNAKMVLFDLATAAEIAKWDTGAPLCGPFRVDRDGKRVFFTRQRNGVSDFIVLNQELTPSNVTTLPFAVSAMESIHE